jgi:polyhydroxyalkanoate synthesis regulator phasin
MTYKELNFLVRNIQASVGDQETKIQKKLFKIFEKIKPTLEEYNEKVNELRLDNASADSEGMLLVDEKGGYKFSKEGVKVLTKQISDLDNSEFHFEKINVVNPQGLEEFIFLKDWVTGVPFEADEEL